MCNAISYFQNNFIGGYIDLKIHSSLKYIDLAKGMSQR